MAYIRLWTQVVFDGNIKWPKMMTHKKLYNNTFAAFINIVPTQQEPKWAIADKLRYNNHTM